MQATRWTKPEDYGDPDIELYAIVARTEGSRAYRVFDRVATLLDDAATVTRSDAVRTSIRAAVGDLAGWTETHDLLRRTLVADRPVGIGELLEDLCRTLRHAHGREYMPLPDVSGETALMMAEPPTAWAIAAAVVEMVEEADRRAPSSIRLRMLDSRMLLLVNWPREPRSKRSRPPASPPPFRESGTLQDLGALLKAKVVRISRGSHRGVGLVIGTRAGDPDEAGR